MTKEDSYLDDYDRYEPYVVTKPTSEMMSSSKTSKKKKKKKNHHHHHDSTDDSPQSRPSSSKKKNKKSSTKANQVSAAGSPKKKKKTKAETAAYAVPKNITTNIHDSHDTISNITSKTSKGSCANITGDNSGSVKISNHHNADEELGGVCTCMCFNNKNSTVEGGDKSWFETILNSFKDMSTMGILGYTLTVVISLSVIVSVPVVVTQTMGDSGGNNATAAPTDPITASPVSITPLPEVNDPPADTTDPFIDPSPVSPDQAVVFTGQPSFSCSDANGITAPQGGAVTTMSSTVGADTTFENAKGAVFYTVVGTGNTFQFSTCSEVTDFPTVVGLSEGCRSWLLVIDESIYDADCPSNPYAAAVSLVTTAGDLYYIYVGAREAGSEGNFQLTVSEFVLPSNAYCGETSKALTQPQGGIITELGSTVNAITKWSSANEAVFYTVVGTGNTFQFSTCSEVTDFPTVVGLSEGCRSWLDVIDESIYDADCPSNPYAAAVSLVTTAGDLYYIYVGAREAGSEGNFQLTVSEFVLPSNAYCGETSKALTQPQGGIITELGSTVNAITKWSSANEAVFYTVVGTGNTFQFSTCSEVTDFPTVVGLSEGCSTYDKIEESNYDADCLSNPNSAAVSFVTTDGVMYYVVIGGRTPGSEGNFQLTVTETASA